MSQELQPSENQEKAYESAYAVLEQLEDSFDNKILDYVYEHYPTQANVSAATTSERGLKEREAMLRDPVFLKMKSDRKIAIDAADRKVTDVYNALVSSKESRQQISKSLNMDATSPLYFQYSSIKEKRPNHIVLMHVGDFYETYGKDAMYISKILGTTYIKDKNHGYGMSGFPHHALDKYLPKLIRNGHKVAISEYLPPKHQQEVNDESQIQQSHNPQIDNHNLTTMSKSRKPQVKQENASETKTESLSKEKTANETIKTTKTQREAFRDAVVGVAGKNVHKALEIKFANPYTVTNAKGKGEVLTSMQVLRGHVTFTTYKGNRLQLLSLSSTALDRLKQKDVMEHIKRARERKNVHEKVEKKNEIVHATKEQQEKFINDIKSLMEKSKYVPLPNFGTKKGVVASLGNKGVSIAGVHQWEDNISFTATVPGKDSKDMLYLHPNDIRPEFYDLLKVEVSKAMQPQLITENGQKVTGAIVFAAKDDPNKMLFYAKLDGHGLHPQVISSEDYIRFTDDYAKDHMSVKNLFEKYYPTKMAKKLDKEEFNDMHLSDGQEITKFRIYKQSKPEKEHYKEYMMYAEIGNRRLHAVPVSHDLLDAYFDRTQSKGQLCEKVLGEQLHLKSAYERYVLPEEVASTKLYKPNGSKEYVVSATLKDGRQTPEKPVAGNDLYSYFRAKTATQQQIASKYLIDDIKAMAKHPLHQQVERHQGLKP